MGYYTLQKSFIFAVIFLSSTPLIRRLSQVMSFACGATSHWYFQTIGALPKEWRNNTASLLIAEQLRRSYLWHTYLWEGRTRFCRCSRRWPLVSRDWNHRRDLEGVGAERVTSPHLLYIYFWDFAHSARFTIEVIIRRVSLPRSWFTFWICGRLCFIGSKFLVRFIGWSQTLWHHGSWRGQWVVSTEPW